jgi:putative hemolysin
VGGPSLEDLWFKLILIFLLIVANGFFACSEIAGGIHDEYDIEERPVERLKDGSLAIDASLSIRDLREDYGLAIPESSEYESLAGFVMVQLQDMPRVGEIIEYGGHKFTIMDMEGRRIVKVKVEKSVQLKVKN